MNPELRVSPDGESGGHCDCCGNETRTVWGYVYSQDAALAAYFVSWTRSNPQHYPNIDLLIGTWGGDTTNVRRLVSWLFKPEGPSFMVIDAASRPAASSSLCSRALSRAEALADEELMDSARSVLDAVWLGDERVSEVKNLANDA